MAALMGSFSTPTICAVSGAKPMNVPAPHPGSRTRPPVKPACCNAFHICSAMAGSV